MRQRTSRVPYFAERTWENETVTPNGDAVVFNGKAREVQGSNETYGGYINEGWYALQWSCIGTEWRVRFLSWQRDTTDRDWWNDTFVTGRGFNHEPNQLLVASVEGVPPGAALDLAMGQGRNALFLASRGWKVVGVDVSDEGQRLARDQAAKRGLQLETVTANIDEWDFGIDRFDLVTLLYAGDDGKWIDKIRTSLRTDGLVVVEGWAQAAPDSPIGFAAGLLASLFADYAILRDEVVESVPRCRVERVFHRADVRARIRKNPIGPVLEQYVGFLHGRGHVRIALHQYVCAAEHFGRWLGTNPITRESVETFMSRHLPACRCRQRPMRQDFSSPFTRALRSATGTAVRFEITPRHLPMFAQQRAIQIVRGVVLVRVAPGASLGAFQISVDGSPVNGFALDPALGNLLAAPLPAAFTGSLVGTHTVVIENAGDLGPDTSVPGDPSAIDPEELADVLFYVEYRFA